MIFSIFLTIFLTVVIPLMMLPIIIMNKNRKQGRLPPGPKKLPVIGNLHQLGQFPHQSLRRLSKKHSPLMFLQLGSVPTLLVSSAAIAKEIFKTSDLVFSSRPAMFAANKLGYKGSTITFAPYGEYWRKIKKIALVELLNPKRVQSFEAVRGQEVALMIKAIAESSDQVNLSALMLLLANNVILRVVFSMKGNSYREEKVKSEFGEILHEAQDLLGMVNIADYLPWMGWYNKLNGVEARVEKNFSKLDSFIGKAIQEHRETPRGSGPDKPEDFIDVLLHVQTYRNQEIRLTDDQMRAVLLDIFIVGTDTSSATLEWIMSELMKNPSVMRKAQEEVRGVVEQNRVFVQESDLPKLKYLRMLVKEALRLHPPAPLLVPRETTEKCTIGGYEIPAKTRVFINAAAISTDPELWDDPEEFKPERFLNSSVDFRGQHFELLPFWSGRRGCPGTNFALLIIELALANLLFSFDWELPGGMNAEDIDMEEAVGITVHKKTPLYLVASSFVYT
ncbi:hypothetical protein DCAR_0208415 [Daucus carota subsp. sativus]|uniref:Cytochrome P450 n=1 Tax=Daucus carota subsp. sativus TaxID=79200 RepID=A0AAF0WGC7_DAUCS|nr:PREDICTED: cytochrome P450 71A9-like [Daucus carota subsp. sativus]WOG89179.1 hypothetical protein DCAR_0208415 [Daucus carota subsp. sativus]